MITKLKTGDELYWVRGDVVSKARVLEIFQTKATIDLGVGRKIRIPTVLQDRYFIGQSRQTNYLCLQLPAEVRLANLQMKGKRHLDTLQKLLRQIQNPDQLEALVAALSGVTVSHHSFTITRHDDRQAA